MKNKKIFLILIPIILLIILIYFMFFNNNTAKSLKIGNNTSSQEIVDNILNVNSYEAIVNVEVISNKNSNKYVIKQSYKGPELNYQEVLEPSNIAGVKISKENGTLKIENTTLNLINIFENYKYISENCLDLNSFIEDYRKDEKATWNEENNQIIMKTLDAQSNRTKLLYINREDGKPLRIEIKDANENTVVYILYNEVNVNN